MAQGLLAEREGGGERTRERRNIKRREREGERERRQILERFMFDIGTRRC